MYRTVLWACGLIAALAPAVPASSQVVLKSIYRPRQTVQEIPVPLVPNPDEKRLQLLIISGRGSLDHDWPGVNNTLRRELQETGRFEVHIIEDFRSGTAETLKPYDVVLINYLGRFNYNDPTEARWGPTAEKALFDYARNGGGVVIYHSSLVMGAPSWPEFERLAGGTMRPEKKSHLSPPTAFQIHIQDRQHPITSGMREYFWTYDDDFYSNMYWDPQAKVHVLATAHDTPADYDPARAGPRFPAYAYSPDKLKAMPGMDTDQPQIWTNEYGKGRVFCISLGHGPDTLLFAGVKDFIARGAEWAATGAVTIPVEANASPGVQDFPIQYNAPTESGH